MQISDGESVGPGREFSDGRKYSDRHERVKGRKKETRKRAAKRLFRKVTCHKNRVTRPSDTTLIIAASPIRIIDIKCREKSMYIYIYVHTYVGICTYVCMCGRK